MSPSKRSLDALVAKASKLNEKTDELNEVFVSLEARLQAANVGVTVWLTTPIDLEQSDFSESRGRNDETEITGSDDVWTFGFAKIGGEWHLAARQERWPYQFILGEEKAYADDSIVISSPIPIVRAPRSVRVAAAGLLDLLVDSLAAQVEEYLADIEKAKATAATT